jgi:tRNA pseudouridine synthase 9
MADTHVGYKPQEAKGLKKIPPYWYPYTTMTKMRWIGRELLEVVSTEFRDRSMEYYVCHQTMKWDQIWTLIGR